MRKVLVSLVLALFVVGASGCYRLSYVTGAPPAGPAYSKRASMFLWGLVGADTIHLRQICPGGLARLDSAQGFVDWLLSYLTLGIYTPMTVYAWCAAGAAPVASVGLAPGRLTPPAP